MAKFICESTRQYFRASIPKKFWLITVYFPTIEQEVCMKKMRHLLVCGGFSVCGRPNKKWKIREPQIQFPLDIPYPYCRIFRIQSVGPIDFLAVAQRTQIINGILASFQSRLTALVKKSNFKGKVSTSSLYLISFQLTSLQG